MDFKTKAEAYSHIRLGYAAWMHPHLHVVRTKRWDMASNAYIPTWTVRYSRCASLHLVPKRRA